MKKIFPVLFGILIPFVPFSAAFAQITGANPDEQSADGQEVLGIVEQLINIIIPIIVALGVLFFFWGVIQYVTAKDEEKKKEARSTMISGIVGLFVIVALWGIIALISNTFNIGIGGSGANVIPEV
jgi:Na+/proline symporter